MRTKSALRREPEAPQLQSHRLKLENLRVRRLESQHREAVEAREAAHASLREQEAAAAADIAEGRQVSPVTLDALRRALDQAVQAERIACQALELARANLERKQQREPSAEERRELQTKFELNFTALHKSMTSMLVAIEVLFELQPEAKMKLGDTHPTQYLPWATLDGIRGRCKTWLESKDISEGRWRS